MHNIFLVYLSICTCFRRLCARHQEKQLYLCDTWYLLFCVDDCLVCRSTCSCIPDGIQYFLFCVDDWYAGWNVDVSHKHSCFSWWWAHSRPKHVEIDKFNKNKLCTELALFTRLYRDARSTKHKKFSIYSALVGGVWWASHSGRFTPIKEAPVPTE